MARLDRLRQVDPVLTTIAIGYRNRQYVGTKLFPIAPSGKEGGKVPRYDQRGFRLYQTQRANGANSTRIRLEPAELIPFVCDEHALEIAITDRESNETPDKQLLRISRTKRVTDGIQLRMEKNQSDLARNPANYPANHVVVLAGAQKFTDPASDPIAVVYAAREQIRRATGFYPNVCLMGAEVYNALKEHPKLVDKFKYVMKGVLSHELLAEAFGCDECVTGDAIWFDPAAGANADIWGKDMILAYVPRGAGENADYEVPAFAYTIRRTGYPVVDSYFDEGPEAEIVRYKDDYVPLVTSNIAGYLIQNAV